MLLPRKWVLSLGLLATVPSITLAGPFDGKPKSNARPAATRPSAKSSDRSNEEIAKDVAREMKGAGVKGKGVDIVVMDGVATLTGQVGSPEQIARATQAASRVAGVDSVDNQLATKDSGSPIGDQSIQLAQYEAPPQGGYQGAPAAGGPAAGGPLLGPPNQAYSTPPPPVTIPAQPAAGPSNQQVAQGIADKMAQAGLSAYDIEIRFKNGACSLIGEVSNVTEAQNAQRAAQSVPGVQQVLNRLTVNGRPVAAAPQPMGRPGAYPPGLAVGQGQLPPGLPSQAAGHNPMIQQMQMQQMQMERMAQIQQTGMGGPGMDGSPMGAPGMGGRPQGGVTPAGHHMMYNQPNVPDYAWPTYAQHDNYAAVTYPSQYDASAFPYIGPFYPYPQVPLNWRQSTLEWKDGSWNLRFSTRTDKWWWFMSPNNWH